jgi:preprotein translocase subunit SecG
MLPLKIIQVVLAILIMASVLLQQRGAGLGDAFGGDSAVFSSRRGAEKVLYQLTVIFSVAFIIVVLSDLLLG